ncbi:EamA family transporter [Zafaria sp. Z1313]|uniref:EamA family transporter n=1 Tax=Zafaria sp. Z1313 TaxID=3423202 RepID=UPI003D301DE4
MTNLESRSRHLTGPAAPVVATAPVAPGGRRRTATGIALVVAGQAANHTGSSLGALAFPVMGPVGVVALRQFTAALVLLFLVRPRLRGLGRGQWLPILGLALVFSVMNLSLYASIERIGLGLAVTLEFLGPLAIAVIGSRRVLDKALSVLAGAGVVVLISPGPATDVAGIALGLLAAAAWACYILLNRTLGERLPGLQGTAVASLVTAAAWVPVAAAWFAARPPTPEALALAAACGVLSSLTPAVADLLALRRIPAPVFGALSSTGPVFAAVAGWLVLHQALAVNEWAGIAVIVLCNAAICTGALIGPRRHLSHRPAGRG